jgi:hypothetical protein
MLLVIDCVWIPGLQRITPQYAGTRERRSFGVLRCARETQAILHDTTLRSGVSLSASRCSAIAREMKRAVIGVPS